MNAHVISLLALVSTMALSGCTKAPEPAAPSGTRAETAAVPASPANPPATPAASSPAASEPAPAMTPAPAGALPQVIVHKSASCGCCTLWVEHMQKAGFTVEVRENDNLNPIKERLGVPLGKESCHTAEVGGYFVEGHIPADDVKRLLADKPDAKGLVVPGMPLGSPGMEAPDGRTQPYAVELVGWDGRTTVFARHGD